jgi:selenocysteine lyase/cysteine desulfurase
MQTTEDLAKEIVDAELRDGLGMQAFDVFATANFFNFKPWAAAIEYLLGVGVESILAHDKNLVEGFVKGLDFDRFDLLSPCESGPRCSTLVFFSHRERARNPVVYRALADAGIDIALRGGLLRLSPHLYNSPADIDRALAVLNTSAY